MVTQNSTINLVVSFFKIMQSSKKELYEKVVKKTESKTFNNSFDKLLWLVTVKVVQSYRFDNELPFKPINANKHEETNA